MLRNGDAVLVAVSGGPDSVALLHILAALAPQWALRLGVAHLHHGLRGTAADEDAVFVAALAARMGLPCHTQHTDVRAFARQRRLSLEDAGRRCRYAFFEATAVRGGYTRIALGHQADDNAELVLMNLLRGSAGAGLAGIPPVRDGRVVRPLIALARTAVYAYLAAHDLSFRVDASNRDPAHRRNRIRHHLLPELSARYNPQLSAALNRLAIIVRDEEAWIESLVAALWAQAARQHTADRLSLSVAVLAAQPLAARRRLVRRAVETLKGDRQRLTFEHVEAVLGLLADGAEDGRLDLPDGLQAARRGGRLEIVRTPARRGATRARPSAAPWGVTLPRPANGPLTVDLPALNARLRCSAGTLEAAGPLDAGGQLTAVFDMERLSFPLTLRSVRPGDRFRPLGVGGHQKVKKFLIDHKVPRDARHRVAVLVSGDRIVWLVGLRIADHAKVSPTTQKVLKAELLLA